MKMTPGTGIGPVTFGITETQLRNVLGDPDKVYEEDATRHLIYNALRMNVWFDRESHGRLEWIACASPHLEIAGMHPIGQPLSTVLECLAAELRTQEVDSEDFGAFESHTFEHDWVEVQSEYGFVSGICIGNLYDDDDTPIWPSETDT